MKEEETQQKSSENDDREFGSENINIGGEALSNAFIKEKEKDQEEKDEENAKTPDLFQDNREDTPKSIPWLTSRTDVSDPWTKLHNEIIEFYRIFGPSSERNLIRKNLFKKVKKFIKGVFPKAIIKMFGSTAAMLYLPNSDIDIVVFLPEKSKNDLKNARKLHKLLSQISWITSCE